MRIVPLCGSQDKTRSGAALRVLSPQPLPSPNPKLLSEFKFSVSLFHSIVFYCVCFKMDSANSLKSVLFVLLIN